MAERQTPLLDIQGLFVEADAGGVSKSILKGVNLTVRRGEIVGLIGESGAGKSTLGLAALGYAKPRFRFSSGSIRFDGQELIGASEKRLRSLRGRRVAYVAQSAAAAFNPAYRLINQFVEGPVKHNTASKSQAKRNAIDLYRRIHLPEPETIGFRYPHQVSGGQLQRAMVAMAMSCTPDLIVFDEPTTALDVITQIEVLWTIREIVRQLNAAAIYITHDLAVVSQMADRIKIMRHGEEVEEGATEQLLREPSKAYTRELLTVRQTPGEVRSVDPAAGEPALEVRDLTVVYDRVAVLRDVFLRVLKGRTSAVVGESGSGKSTLARCIAGLLAPDGGSIRMGGHDLPARITERSKEALRKVQLIHQSADTALNPQHRIRDILGRPLEHFLGLKGSQRDRRTSELLTLMDMDPVQFLERRPFELSGGQKQRVSIARALAADPEVIICDEITAALDPLVAAEIMRLLKRVQAERGISYLFITHDLDAVQAHADDVVVLHQGRVMEAAPSDEFFASPKSDYSRTLIAATPKMRTGWLSEVLALRVTGVEWYENSSYKKL